jgi:hypothetical protein
MELQVALPKTGRELQGACKQSKGAAECVRDKESAVDYNLQAIGMVHGVIGDEEHL